MIGKVTKGNGVQKLLWYLWGPGRANEHTEPHLVAVWGEPGEQDLATLEPTRTGGRPDVRPLARLLEQPLAAQQRPPTKAVWQASLRLAPEDRPLTDAEWDHVAREVMHRTGFTPRDDPVGCRWIAMRHGPDHIHLAVVLARQDGQPVDTRNDYYKMGQTCRDLEAEYGLRRTAPRDRSGPRRPTRAELEKAARAGKPVTARDKLRHEARLAAAAASNTEEFFARLRARGVMVRPRYSQQDPVAVTGYSVAWPGDRTASGQTVWFGGSKLSADLSWTRLRDDWTTKRAARTHLAPQTHAEFTVPDAAAAIARATSRLLLHRPSPVKREGLSQLERAALTLVLALADHNRRGPVATRLILRDRAASAARRSTRKVADAQLLESVTRWTLGLPRTRNRELRHLLLASARLIEAIDHGSSTDTTPERQHPGVHRPIRTGRGSRVQ